MDVSLSVCLSVELFNIFTAFVDWKMCNNNNNQNNNRDADDDKA